MSATNSRKEEKIVMRRLLAFVASCCVFILFSASGFAQQDMVKLIRAENYETNGYHCCWYGVENILIQVKNVAYAKEVYVHRSTADGPWVDVPARYVRQADSTYELWEVDETDFAGYPVTEQFVLKYVVNGQTYWDNNNNANYRFLDNSYYGPGPMLGSYIDVLLSSASIYSYNGQKYVSMYVDLRNIAPTKNVSVIYTTDNWATTRTLSPHYRQSIATGYSTFINFPNEYGFERWSVSEPVDVSGFHFYIAYTVNGVTYYDNNYRANYYVHAP